MTTDGTYRIHYEISRDEGRTWEAYRLVIHFGDDYDALYWLPDVTHGINSAYVESCPPTVLEDGTIVIGIIKSPLAEDGTLHRLYGGYWV